MTLLSALVSFQKCNLFKSVVSIGDDFLHWEFLPMPLINTVPAEGDEFWLIRACQIPSSIEAECLIDLVAPERITDYVYLFDGVKVTRKHYSEISFRAIPRCACEFNGSYDLYYSKETPDIGIEILKSGLRQAKVRAPIAQDLAYIYRDEKRWPEALVAFTILIDEGVNISSCAYRERANIYNILGDLQRAHKDICQAESLEAVGK